MGSYDREKPFRQCWDKAVGVYRGGNRLPSTYFSTDETAYLASIGCTALEMYDFAEDSDELSFDTVLLITAAQRDYFLVVREGCAIRRVVTVDDFPPKDAELAGFAWLPRLLLKARSKLRGEMPAE